MGLFGDHEEHHGNIPAVFGNPLTPIMMGTCPQLAPRNVFPSSIDCPEAQVPTIY
jgi:hypothetical protein